MKYFTLLALVLMSTISWAQSLPFNFESDITTSNFEDFDGGMAEVVTNPQSSGINTSATVGRIVRDGGTIWSGSKILLTENLDFTTNNTISMKVFSSAPVGTVVKFKLEGNGATERDALTTVSNEWETLTWDFTGVSTDFNYVVFMFDFGNVGDGTINSTFFFDDVEQLFGGEQIDFPVDFESNVVNYNMTDFGGNASQLAEDPTNSNNHVIEVVKTDEAATWAGTTIGTNAGFKTNLPLALGDSKMNVAVWSPTAGTPIRLKVEDSNDPTHTCETEVLTTVGGAWEVLEFDFSIEAPGTAALSFGLNAGWTYNMASIFFNFGTEGVDAGEQTYYFDNVFFGDIASSTQDISDLKFDVFPNPTNSEWNILSENQEIDLIEIFSLDGRRMHFEKLIDTSIRINAQDFDSGMYVAKLHFDDKISILKLVKN